MRHRIAGKKLGRKTSHRKATIRFLARATLYKERICTTKVRAKEARKLVERLITLGKKGTLAAKRNAFDILSDHKLVSILFNETAPRFKNRIGGYTRIIPLGYRQGDNANLVFLELTEKKEIVLSKPKAKKAAKSKEDTEATLKAVSEKKVEPKLKKEVKDITDAQIKHEASHDEAHKEHSEVPKHADIKIDKKQATVMHDKTSSNKHMFSGLRKIFNKKSTGK